MLRWFHRLMPKEERFFELFAQHSHAVVAGAVALRAMLEGGDAIPINYQTVMDREHDADNVTREVLIATVAAHYHSTSIRSAATFAT